MTADFIPSVIVEPEFLLEAQEANSFLLKVPEHARTTGRGTKLWTELFSVIESSMGVVENNKDRIEIIVRFQVAADSEDATNIGSFFRARYLVNPTAMRGAKDKSNKERTMSLMSMNRLGSLLVAAGLREAGEGSGFDLKDFFAGESPAVQGAQVYALLKHYKDKEDVSRQDILQFDDLSAGKQVD